MLKDLETKITQLVENEIVTSVFELISIKVSSAGRRTIISIAMDRDSGGITVAECAEWNRQIGRRLDEEGCLEGPYVIEVSSPGLDRQLKTQEDFNRVVGKNLRVHYRNAEGAPVQGTMTLIKVEQDAVLLKSPESDKEIRLSLSEIISAKQDIQVAKKG